MAKIYNGLLADVEGMVTPDLAEGHVFHQYTVRVMAGRREKVEGLLVNRGVGL